MSGLILGIEGLQSDRQQLDPGMPYLIELEDSAMLTILALNLAKKNQEKGFHVTVLAADEHQPTVTHLQREQEHVLGGANTEILRLKSSQLPPERPTQLPLNLNEICVQSPDLLLVLCAEPLFNWHKPKVAAKQLSVFRQWLKANSCSAVFISATAGLIPSSMAANTRIARQFAGRAELLHAFGKLTLRRYHWQHKRKKVEDSLPLESRSQTLCHIADDASAQTDKSGTHAPILSESSALPGISTDLQVVTFDSKNELLNQAGISYAPMCLLAYADSQTFRELAETVHRLRQITGKYAVICVRELGCKLRYAEEHALTALGMTAVIPEHINESEVIRMMKTLEGHALPADITDDFDQALNIAASTTSRGYLAGNPFVELARQALMRASRIQTECSLIELTLRPDTGHLQALKQINLSRAGDIATTTTNSILIMLPDCPVSEAAQVLTRVCNGNPELLAQNITYYHRHADIQNKLNTLARITEETSSTDLNFWLETADPLEQQDVDYPLLTGIHQQRVHRQLNP